MLLTPKVVHASSADRPDRRERGVRQAIDLVNPASPKFNPAAAHAMNGNHLKDTGGLECYAWHSSWVPSCFGCHFERDERLTGLNLMTGQQEIGKVSTNNKIFESLNRFMMGPNSAGRMASYIVGCQPMADVTAVDGSKILDFAMPSTVNGKSGLALQPVQAHTVRGKGEVRTCAECHRSPPTLGFGSGNNAVARTRAFVVGSGGVEVVDRAAVPTQPVPLGTLSASQSFAVASLPNVIEGTADYLYVAAGTDGLQIYDLRYGIPASPVNVVSNLNAIDVARAARYLYVVDDGYGIRIYDNDVPSSADPLTSVPIAGALRAVPWGIHLFVAAGSLGLHVFDITQPGSVVAVSSLEQLGGPVVDLTVASQLAPPGVDDYALLAKPTLGLQVVDVTDPAQPVLVGVLPAPGAAGVFVEVQQLDRFLDEQGNPLKENSHPGAGVLSREEIVRILEAPIE